MIMADVLKIFLIVVGLLVTFVSYWLLFQALAPERVARAREAYRDRPKRALLYGLLAGLPLTLLGAAFANAPAAPIKLLGVTLLLFLGLVALQGSAGLAQHIGMRLPSAHDESEPWRRVLRGGTVLALCFVLPGIGWFVVLPAALVTGFGAAVIARRASEPVAAMPAPANSLEGLQ